MRNPARPIVLACLLPLVFAAPAAAQAADPSEGEGVRLMLSECLRKALENNLDLVIARKDPQIAEARIDIPRSEFDPMLGVTGEYARADVDETISQTGEPEVQSSSTTDNPRLDASWGQKLQFGGRYDVALNLLESDTSPSIGIDRTTGFTRQSDPLYRQGSLRASFEMPLLKGLGKEVTTADIVLARSGLEVSREALSQQAQATLQQVESAYWDVLAANEALRVAGESLKLAEDLLQLNKKKVEVGTLAPIEITQAEAGVASRKEGVIVARTAVENAEDQLRKLMAFPASDPIWDQRIIPTDRPVFREESPDLKAAIARALSLRPEIVTARRNLEDSQLSERVAKDGVRHDLKLQASAGPMQSEATVRLQYINLPNSPLIDAKTNTDEWDWSVGLVYGFPIFNRAAKANYAIATLEREKSEVGLRNVEQSIRVDVRTAVRNVESGAERVAAAQANTVLQRKTLEAEQKKFENGMSTSFEVLQIQTDLLNAQLAEIKAILDYTNFLAALERAQGTLLEARGLRLEDTKER